MSSVSVIDTLKYAFNTFFRNFFFFVKATMFSFFVWLAGAILSAIVASPFLLPGLTIYSKIKIIFQEAFSGIYAQPTALKGAAKGAIMITKFKEAGSKVLARLYELFPQHPYIFISIAIGLIVFFVGIMITNSTLFIGWNNISLEFYDKKSSSILSLFVKPIYILRAFLLAIFLYLMTTPVWIFSWYMGSLIPVFEGLFSIASHVLIFYISFKFAYSLLFIIDKKIALIGAMKKSFRIPRGAIKLFLLNLLMFGPINILLVIAFLLTLLIIALPLGYFKLMSFPIFAIFFFFMLGTIICTMLVTLSLGTAFLYRRLTAQQK